ncbi:MAG: hypothetical protein EBT03_07960 [Betaproteobacteria bacterium]|nr:hypothetical protein [Betaproteobacteria bacterium]NCA17030.1 hypothetical protein [Betaproteobacteria bacterium]
MPTDNMSKLQSGYEQHSFNSLARRLRHLVSRQTLTEWVRGGKLKPALKTEGSHNSHLLFHKKKLDQLLQLLEKGYQERLEKFAKTNAEAARYRAAATANALRVFEANKKRRAAGQDEIVEPNPCMNDSDARGIVHLTHGPKAKKIFSGFGLYR